MRYILSAACVLLFAHCSTIHAQPDQQPFNDTASVFAVELPVRVLVSGQPVRDLELDDFEIWDRGKRRDIHTLELIDLQRSPSTPGDEPGANPRNSASPPQNHLFLFDFAYSGSGSLARALDASRALVERRLPPGSRVAVAFFSALRGLKILGGFSDRQTQIDRAFGTLSALLARDAASAQREYASLLLEEGESDSALRATLDQVASEATILARSDPYWPHRSVIRRFSEGLTALPGLELDRSERTTVYLLSHGFDSLYLTGRNSVGTLDRLEQSFRSLRQAGWTLNSINIGGLRAPNGRDTLFYLAHETGGESYENFNVVGEAFERLLERSSVTYVLVFYANDVESDGSFHRLRVRLRNGLPGARIVHRPGYYAPTKSD